MCKRRHFIDERGNSSSSGSLIRSILELKRRRRRSREDDHNMHWHWHQPMDLKTKPMRSRNLSSPSKYCQEDKSKGAHLICAEEKSLHRPHTEAHSSHKGKSRRNPKLRNRFHRTSRPLPALLTNCYLFWPPDPLLEVPTRLSPTFFSVLPMDFWCSNEDKFHVCAQRQHTWYA